jgi:hypothetical protein
VAKGDGLEADFQDGRQFLRSLKRKRINNQSLATILNITPTPNPNPRTNPRKLLFQFWNHLVNYLSSIPFRKFTGIIEDFQSFLTGTPI